MNRKPKAICRCRAATTDERVQIEWQEPLSGVHSTVMVISAQLGEGWGTLHALSLSLYLPSRAKLWCTIQLRLQIHSYFSSVVVTLNFRPMWVGEGK
jgi:hypothetical protein